MSYVSSHVFTQGICGGSFKLYKMKCLTILLCKTITWTNDWTYEKARDRCTSYFTKKNSEEIREASGVKISDCIDSSIADIKVKCKN